MTEDESIEEQDNQESAARESGTQRSNRSEGGQGRGGSRGRMASSRDDRSRRPQDAHALLTEFLPARAQSANPHLRSCLTGKITISLHGSGQKYLFDWSGEEPRVEEGGDSASDCSISLTEDNLMRISGGELNPQVAMLSDKIRVEGRASLAIYLFNLLGARHILG